MAKERKYVQGFEELSTTEFIRMIFRSPVWEVEDQPYEYRFLLKATDSAGNRERYCSPNLLSMPYDDFELFCRKLKLATSGDPAVTEDILDPVKDANIIPGIVDQRELS